jgi:hypothetical protein
MAEVREQTRFELPGFGGQLFHPGDPAYNEARAVFNAMIDRKPALIARCTSADDVAAAVNLAREQGIPLSVYGGSRCHRLRCCRRRHLHRPSRYEGR